MLRPAAWLVACLVLAGCATRFENYPLAGGQANPERRAVDVSHAERPLILVAVSGGGSRAAALGWVVLREIAKFRYAAGGQSRSLIDDIGVVSSVSGGSVIAAHFALYGPEGLERFAPDFLVPDNMRTLGLDAVNPISWFKLAVTGSSRIDIVGELFDNQLFNGVQVDFDRLRSSDPRQRELHIKVNAIPTAWSITKENRDVLEEAGTILLQQHPCFQRLLEMDIKAEFSHAAFAKAGCRQTSD